MTHWGWRLTVAVVLTAFAQAELRAENWPAWRGPRGDGTSLETSVPTKWSTTENVVWKTPIPGQGHSSPIVWEDKIFLTTADTATKDRILICLDRKTGKVLWQKTVVNAPLETKQNENSYASSTPATDGEKVYVAFLQEKDVLVAAYDFTGEQKWLVKPGPFESPWGFCHSPVLFEDKLLLASCGKTYCAITALKRTDGSKVWNVEPKPPSQSFSAPLVREMGGRMQMVVQQNTIITSYDPRDGKELWTSETPGKEFVTTPVFSEKAGLVLCGTSWPIRWLLAFKPDGQGKVTDSKLAWKIRDGAPYVPSPIACGDYFLTACADNKSLYCYNAATGEVVWKEAGAGLHHASPVVANGLVYFQNDDGVTRVIKPGPKFELVSQNELGEKVYASPAISQGQIFIRSFGNLYCIGAGK